MGPVYLPWLVTGLIQDPQVCPGCNMGGVQLNCTDVCLQGIHWLVLLLVQNPEIQSTSYKTGFWSELYCIISITGYYTLYMCTEFRMVYLFVPLVQGFLATTGAQGENKAMREWWEGSAGCILRDPGVDCGAGGKLGWAENNGWGKGESAVVFCSPQFRACTTICPWVSEDVRGGRNGEWGTKMEGVG